MTIERHWLITGAAVVAALGLGFGAAKLTDRAPARAEAGAEEGHAEEEGGGLVELTPAQATAAGVRVVAVERGGGAELMLPGRVEFAPGAEALVDAPLAGVVIQVHAAPGTRVRAGSPLVTLRSPDGAAARATADAAEAAADAARAAADRDRSLFDRGYVAKSRLEITDAEARRADAELRAARARARAFGSPGEDGVVMVRSPVAGVVTRMSTAMGSVLHEEALAVAVVADATRVELAFEAPPGASALLKAGDRLTGRTADGQTVTAVVTAVAPAGETGVVAVRARPDGFIPPAGTVISARVATGRGQGALVVPSEAVQTVDGTPSVFVAEAGGFRARPVVTGRTADGRIEILSGLTGDERVVGAGAFLLKAELAKGSIEHEH